jgi:hypothetical protein
VPEHGVIPEDVVVHFDSKYCLPVLPENLCENRAMVERNRGRGEEEGHSFLLFSMCESRAIVKRNRGGGEGYSFFLFSMCESRTMVKRNREPRREGGNVTVFLFRLVP